MAAVPGDVFGVGGAGYNRGGYATDINKIKVALERIAALVRELHG